MTDKDFSIIRANQIVLQFYWYREEELKSFTFRDFTHSDYITNDEISLLDWYQVRFRFNNTEKRYIRNGGSVIWGSTTVNIIRNKQDEVQFFLVMIEDITSRKKVAAELEHSVSLLKATFESTEDGLLVVNSSGEMFNSTRSLLICGEFLRKCWLQVKI